MSLEIVEWCLEFDGVNDYAEARTNSVLHFGLPVKFDLEFHSLSGSFIGGKGRFGSDTDNYVHNIYSNDLRFDAVGTPSSNYQILTTPTSGLNTNQRYITEWLIDSSDYVFTIDGVEVDRQPISVTPAPANPYKFRLGKAPSGLTNLLFNGKIYSFQIGTETFEMNEGPGNTTIEGSEGTILDIHGATWKPVYKQITDAYIEDAGVLKAVEGIYLGTSSGFKTVYEKTT